MTVFFQIIPAGRFAGRVLLRSPTGSEVLEEFQFGSGGEPSDRVAHSIVDAYRETGITTGAVEVSIRPIVDTDPPRIFNQL